MVLYLHQGQSQDKQNKTGKYHKPSLIATKTSDNLKLKYILEKCLTRMTQIFKTKTIKNKGSPRNSPLEESQETQCLHETQHPG